MRHKIVFLIILVATAVSCNRSDERIQPRKGDIIESVYASVTLQPDSLYAAYAAVGGIVAQTFVNEGDVVSKGAPLMQITNDAPQLNTENARLALELARKNLAGQSAVLKELEENIAVARLQLQQDSLSYFRQKSLWEKNIGTQNEYDARRTAYEIARKNLMALESRYYRTKNELETQVQQAENNYRTSLIATHDYTVKSQINGKVYDVFKDPGELVNLQEPVASVGSAQTFVIELLIDEVDIARVEKGQQVLVTLDAYKGEVFSAVLTRIYPQKNERTQTFKAEARFSNPPGKLYPGLSGEGNIIINKKEGALIIPRNYMVDAMHVKTEDGLVKVTTGLYNMDEIEIRSGIDANTYLYKP